MIARPLVLTSTEVATALVAEHFGPAVPLLRISTDTRDALSDSLFVALRGERFDGHEFLTAALAGGASALLVEKAAWSQRSLVPHTAIVVPDTLRALGELARWHRRRLGTSVCALTGSNGKTTTKELLASVLEVESPVLKTEGNLNNLIGVPLTLLGLQPDHQAAVVEMGMNRPGEIARYTELAEPRVGLIVNVGPAHIGELGSMEAIAEAKAELYRGLTSDSVAVVNVDDAWVVRMAEKYAPKAQRTFGRHPRADVCLVSAEPQGEGQNLVLRVDGTTVEARLPLPGAHNALNAAGAVAAATALRKTNLESIVNGLQSVAGIKGRLAFRGVGPWVVVDDAYNANAASMIAAIETVAERARRDGRRWVAFFGEMRELGQFSPEEHAKVGRAAAQAGAAFIAVFGALASPLAQAAAAVPVFHTSESVADLFAWAKPQLQPGDLILVKGSRGAQMERFTALLEQA